MSAESNRTGADDEGSGRGSHLDCLAGGGEMGALMRSTDWRRTIFGPVSDWPQSLRTAISMMLESRFAMVVAWGPEFRFFYNDRYRPVLGTKHPSALGTPGAEIFPEVWSVVGPEFERVRRGEAFAIDDWLLPLERNGYLENCWFTLSYSPIRDESGGVGGLLAVVAETTGRVEGERRLATLRDLARRASDAKTPEQACVNAAQVFRANTIDVPFALIYLLNQDATIARRVAAVGIAPDHPANVIEVRLDAPALDAWGLGDVARSGEARVRADLAGHQGPLGILPAGPYTEATHTALLLPLSRPGLDHPYGVLVAGVSPRRALDDRYRDFFELAADHIATAVSNAVALQDARRRAEALAELDRAKTAFFSNVSHEFRTPLTLMLGPAEELLAGVHGTLTVPQRAQVEIVQRNAGRLLKLVNALLDFSRIEAGRAQAVYRQTDLAALTTRARRGVPLGDRARRPALRGRVRADRTSRSTSTVTCGRRSSSTCCRTRSSSRSPAACGSRSGRLTAASSCWSVTPASASRTASLPRVFERFHRVEGARARTHEGSGIGLALTDELVRLHGGSVTVTSRVGEGTTFIVQIPTGRAHLPPDRVDAAGDPTGPINPAPFVDEAVRWLPAPAASSPPERDHAAAPGDRGGRAAPAGPRERILVVDDNADMRDYLRQLLGDWELEHGGRWRLRAGRRARTAAGPGHHRRHDAGHGRVRAAAGAARRSAHAERPGPDAVGAGGRGVAGVGAGRRRRRLRHQAVQRARADRARAIADRARARQAGGGAAETASAVALHAGAHADRHSARAGSRHRARQPDDLSRVAAQPGRSAGQAAARGAAGTGRAAVQGAARRRAAHRRGLCRQGGAGAVRPRRSRHGRRRLLQLRLCAAARSRRRHRRRPHHRLRRDRRDHRPQRDEPAARRGRIGQPHQGRVPRHARTRAAQPAGARSSRRCS